MERNRRGRLPWAIVLLILAVCCGIAFGAAKWYVAAHTPSNFADYRALQLDAIQSLQTVGDGFVYYDGSAITKIGEDGQSRWNYMIGGGAELQAGDAGVAAWVGQTLTLIDGSTGVTGYSNKMEAEILSAKVGAQYAAVLLGPEHNSTIVLMETGGRRVDSITLADQTVIDYGFFYNDSLFWVMILDTNGTVPSCTINTYRPGRRLVGSITDSEQILYHTSFQSAQISCTGDTFIKVYNYNGAEESDKRNLVYGWTLADDDEGADNPIMAFVPNAQFESGELMHDVRMIRGSTERTVRMPWGCSWLVAVGNRVYGFSNEGYIMVAQIDSQRVGAHRLSVPFDRVYGVTDGGVALLGYGTTVYFVPLG